jgi:hypothetical protein
LDAIMSQLPEFEPGAIRFCVRRSASVRWLQRGFASVIGAASSGPSTGSAGAELVSGKNAANFVLVDARAGTPASAINASAILARVDTDASDLQG